MGGRGAREPWATPFAVTRPVYLALTGLVVLGMGAVLGGALVREHLDHRFHPDWAVWAPVTVAVGLGVLGMAALATLAQRLPPAPVPPAGPMPESVAPGTARALLRGEPLTPEQHRGVQQLVDDTGKANRRGAVVLGPLYLLLGVVGVLLHTSEGYPWLTIGAVFSVFWLWTLRRRRLLLREAARRGITPRPDARR